MSDRYLMRALAWLAAATALYFLQNGDLGLVPLVVKVTSMLRDMERPHRV